LWLLGILLLVLLMLLLLLLLLDVELVLGEEVAGGGVGCTDPLRVRTSTDEVWVGTVLITATRRLFGHVGLVGAGGRFSLICHQVG